MYCMYRDIGTMRRVENAFCAKLMFCDRWHFVEALDDSISVNMWTEHELDAASQVVLC
jgi:hypothetical protein